MRLLVFLAGLYLIAPGHPDLPLSGLPLGQVGTLVLVALIGTWLWCRHAAAAAPRRSLTTAIVIVLVLKIAIAAMAPVSGWRANYYANDQWQPPAKRSIDFRGLGATRVDRRLSFNDTEFPVHFFNEHGFNFGLRREATEAFTVEWTGELMPAAATALKLRLEARGHARVLVDGQEVAVVDEMARAGGVTDRSIDLAAGSHTVTVRYQKPKETEGILRLRPLTADGAPRDWDLAEVTPSVTARWQRAASVPLAWLAWLLHLAALATVAMAMGPAVREALRSVAANLRVSPAAAAHQLAGPVVVAGLALQGAWKARGLVGQVWTLTGGDDWLGYEMNGRDIALNGLLNNNGDPTGLPFFEYPGYGYFLALVHVVTGESIAGAILANFLCLAAATLLVYALARLLVGPVLALAALAWVLIIEQLDFVRYYTVTLLSENLFVLPVSASVLLITRYLRTPDWRYLAGGAVAGGLAAVVRPTMMAFMPPVALIILVARWRASAVSALMASLMFAALWMVAVSPATIRNYLVSGSPVLITTGQAKTFIDYNRPSGDAKKYYAAFDGSMSSTAKVLLWILYDHPGETLRGIGTKVGFSMGMVHWMGNGTPHPELLVTSIFYLLGILLLPEARTITAAPLHAFILTHLFSLTLSMPSNYGYRLPLPMYLFMPIFSGAVVSRPLLRWMGVRL
ncbi:MAG: glycosyltransferase family 39 protein [Vicinamibacterales bacterium]